MKLPGAINLFTGSRELLLEELSSYLLSPSLKRLVTLNPEIYLAARKEPRLLESISASDLIVPDGIGLVWLARRLGSVAERLPGIELAWALLGEASAKKLKVALCGASPEALEGTKKRLKREFPSLEIVYSRDGFFASEREYLEAVSGLASSGAALTLLALPYRRQEQLAYDLQRSGMALGLVIGVGGSFDVWSGNVKRAPIFFQRLQLEWFWRLLLQPERFRRVFPMIWDFLPVLILGR